MSMKIDFITSTFTGTFSSLPISVASFTLFLPMFLLEIMTKTLSYANQVIQCHAKQKRCHMHEIGQRIKVNQYQ